MGSLKWVFQLGVLLVCLSPPLRVAAQPTVALAWITNSSVKIEQVIGDVDWEAKYFGTNLPTASQTATRFNVAGNGHGYSFEDNGKLIFLFGDTISGSNVWSYDAADPLAWSTNTSGDQPLVLNFFTNRPFNFYSNWPVFVQPAGIDMGGDAIPGCGISLSNGTFLICETGNSKGATNSHEQDFSVLVTFNENACLTAPNTYPPTNIFVTNRVISVLTTNLATNDLRQGHFILDAMHEFGTNVLIYGAGEYRASDIYLSMVPAANIVSGQGTVYFSGLVNGQAKWDPYESNSVPVVQDNPTNGPAWPNDTPGVEKVSVIYSTNLNLWMMIYKGGENVETGKHATKGIYFSYAPQPWGPWTIPQFIFNEFRDGGEGVFIYNAANDTGPGGPVINPDHNDGTNRAGDAEAPMLIERFTRITNSTLYIYYMMSTWNPYTVVKMRSSFAILPVIDPMSLVHKNRRFSFSWTGLPNETYQVEYSSNMLSGWSTFTNLITSTNSTFSFTDNLNISAGIGVARFYRVRTPL